VQLRVRPDGRRARLGAKRLVDAAEKFGFNESPGIPGAKTSTIPKRMAEGNDEVGSSALGQGRVLATPLQMAVTAGVIANDGMRAKLTLRAGQKPEYVRVTSPRIARIVKDMMVEVVKDPTATGPAAAVSGVTVAGKTGTAEVGEDLPENGWFAAFAPAERPQVAVGVLIVGGGAGGDSAAPVAGSVLSAAVSK
jgi:cell division protein FtsI/penicillin-binding protein 2